MKKNLFLAPLFATLLLSLGCGSVSPYPTTPTTPTVPTPDQPEPVAADPSSSNEVLVNEHEQVVAKTDATEPNQDSSPTESCDYVEQTGKLQQ